MSFTWGYRAVQGVDGTVSLREVYYDRSGKIIAHCDPEALEFYEDHEGLKNALRDMLEDVEKPLLQEAHLPANAPPADATYRSEP